MTSLVNKIARYGGLVLVGVLVIGLTGCATPSDPLAQLREKDPDPRFNPREVVEIQLTALGNNTDSDEGIGIAFRFASPVNRATTGPLPRFAAMIKQGPYTIMLDNDRIEYAPVAVTNDVAIQRVRLYRGSIVAVFDFVLRKQSSDLYRDCWMTEGVIFRGVQDESPGITV